MPTSAKECHTYIVEQKSKKQDRNAMTHDLSLGREIKKQWLYGPLSYLKMSILSCGNEIVNYRNMKSLSAC